MQFFFVLLTILLNCTSQRILKYEDVLLKVQGADERITEYKGSWTYCGRWWRRIKKCNYRMMAEKYRHDNKKQQVQKRETSSSEIGRKSWIKMWMLAQDRDEWYKLREVYTILDHYMESVVKSATSLHREVGFGMMTIICNVHKRKTAFFKWILRRIISFLLRLFCRYDLGDPKRLLKLIVY